MSKDQQQEPSGLRAVLELGWDAMRLGWATLGFFGGLAARLLPKASSARIPESGRQEDRLMESAAEAERRERWGTALVLCSFTIAIAGGLAFVICYWTGAVSTVLLGGSLTVFLAGMGFTLVLWARWMMLHKEAVEPREVLRSTAEERKDTAEAFCKGGHDVRRRRMLQWMTLGAGAVFTSMVVSLFRSLGLSPDPSSPGW